MRLMSVAISVATMAIASAAAAQDQPTQTVVEPATATFQLNVTANVAQTCGFQDGFLPQENVDVGNLNGTVFQRDVPFQLTCTGPFRVGIVSQNGALKASAGALPVGYTDT